MDAASGMVALQAAGQIGAETAAYVARAMPEVEQRLRTVRGQRGRSEAEKARVYHEVQRIVAPIVEHVLTQAEKLIAQVGNAFDVQTAFPLGDDLWSMGLLGLAQTQRNIEMVADTFRREARTSRVARVLWPPEWETRYDAITDALDDYSESIALGLDPETRADIEARAASVRRV